MKINTDYLFRMFKYAHNTKTAIMLRGAHGIGKSTLPDEYSESNGYYFEHQFATGQDPSDLVGLTKDRKVMQGDKEVDIQYWTQPIWLHRIWEQHYLNKKTVFLLDEMNRANEEVLQMCLSILNDRKIHEHKLPDDCLIIVAVNPDSAVGGQYANVDYNVASLDKAVYDRVMLIDIEVDKDRWIEYAYRKKLHPSIIEFVDIYDSVLYEPVENQSNHATPRSWVKFSGLLKEAEKDYPDGIPEDFLIMLATSKIGESASYLFKKHYLENTKFSYSTTKNLLNSYIKKDYNLTKYFNKIQEESYLKTEKDIQSHSDPINFRKSDTYLNHAKDRSDVYEFLVKPLSQMFKKYLEDTKVDNDLILNTSTSFSRYYTHSIEKFTLVEALPLMVLLYSVDLEIKMAIFQQFKELAKSVNKENLSIYIHDIDDNRYLIGQISNASENAKKEKAELQAKKENKGV